MQCSGVAAMISRDASCRCPHESVAGGHTRARFTTTWMCRPRALGTALCWATITATTVFWLGLRNRFSFGHMAVRLNVLLREAIFSGMQCSRVAAMSSRQSPESSSIEVKTIWLIRAHLTTTLMCQSGATRSALCWAGRLRFRREIDMTVCFNVLPCQLTFKQPRHVAAATTRERSIECSIESIAIRVLGTVAAIIIMVPVSG
mmetsp:Transcript_12354/g.18531  ORF Transcript_12354/g.18531 Transcript_12354/m.18531 type:complete len:203 (-) Transcript_12354:179-787(-)